MNPRAPKAAAAPRRGGSKIRAYPKPASVLTPLARSAAAAGELESDEDGRLKKKRKEEKKRKHEHKKKFPAANLQHLQRFFYGV